jgi:hypothetical protein
VQQDHNASMVIWCGATWAIWCDATWFKQGGQYGAVQHNHNGNMGIMLRCVMRVRGWEIVGESRCGKNTTTSQHKAKQHTTNMPIDLQAF